MKSHKDICRIKEYAPSITGQLSTAFPLQRIKRVDSGGLIRIGIIRTPLAAVSITEKNTQCLNLIVK